MTTSIYANIIKSVKWFFAIILAFSMTAGPAAAQGIPLVRDAEIEALVREYSQPIFKVAGFKSNFVAIHLVRSNQFNAFVADGRRMFINLGTLRQAATPNEVIGVIAHEAGHIAGGHLSRIRQAVAGARTISIVSSILAGAAIVAGAASGSRSAAEAGAGLLQGSGSIAARTILAHQRSEEVAADRSAVTYLERTGQSSVGMLKTFETLQRQIPVTASSIDPYVLSHPLPRERIGLIQNLVNKSKFRDKKDSASMIARHKLMQAKISAFTEHPQRVGRRYPSKDKSLAADYARAIVGYRFGKVKRAQKNIDKLISRAPNYPYFWELKGQAYLEGGQPKNAIAPLRKALKLAPGQPIMQTLLGHALVATNNPKNNKEAIKVLTKAILKDQTIANAHTQLAIAHSRAGQTGLASLATANGLFFLGDIRGAKFHASRAKKKLKTGSRGWIQADDILKFKNPRL
ncbi:MAG: M48 family metalloprotease [Hyphomicrobiales bacterium]